MAYPGDDDRILEKGQVGEYVGLRIQPRQPILLDLYTRRQPEHDHAQARHAHTDVKARVAAGGYRGA
jgi:hypothetical protein